MTGALEQDAGVVETALQRHAEAVSPIGIGRWRFTIHGNRQWQGCALMNDDWLMLRVRQVAPLAGRVRATESLLQMLRANALLRGGVKFAMESRPRQIVLVGEILLEEQGGLDNRIREVMEGLRQAAMSWPNLEPSLLANPERTRPPEGDTWGQNMNLWQEAGLTPTVRGDGQLFVRLDVPGEFCQAMLSISQVRRARVIVELTNAAMSAVAQHAMQVLLLESSRVVCMARATACHTGDGLSYGWETVFPETTSVRAVQVSIATLSLACRLTMREARALQDERIAKEYLQLRG
jgi:hypothetical protein